ncbi:MAG: hypothetical protein ACK58T_16760, partial [Phycisphaerae bacterium]
SFTTQTFVIAVSDVNEAPLDLRTATQNVSVNNFSFESDVLADNSSNSSATGWTMTGLGGTYNPSTTAFASGNGTNGSNVGWLNSGSMEQVLGTNFSSAANYQLSVDVGRGLDQTVQSYTVQL